MIHNEQWTKRPGFAGRDGIKLLYTLREAQLCWANVAIWNAVQGCEKLWHYWNLIWRKLRTINSIVTTFWNNSIYRNLDKILSRSCHQIRISLYKSGTKEIRWSVGIVRTIWNECKCWLTTVQSRWWERLHFHGERGDGSGQSSIRVANKELDYQIWM